MIEHDRFNWGLSRSGPLMLTCSQHTEETVVAETVFGRRKKVCGYVLWQREVCVDTQSSSTWEREREGERKNKTNQGREMEMPTSFALKPGHSSPGDRGP